MLNVFESQLAVRRAFQSETQKGQRPRFRPLAALAGWFRKRRADASVATLDPALLADVGLRRVGDIVVAAETPDCANDDCTGIFSDKRVA